MSPPTPPPRRLSGVLNSRCATRQARDTALWPKRLAEEREETTRARGARASRPCAGSASQSSAHLRRRGCDRPSLPKKCGRLRCAWRRSSTGGIHGRLPRKPLLMPQGAGCGMRQGAGCPPLRKTRQPMLRGVPGVMPRSVGHMQATLCRRMFRAGCRRPLVGLCLRKNCFCDLWACVGGVRWAVSAWCARVGRRRRGGS